jgi:DNA-binding XRE family transcriptional regulator
VTADGTRVERLRSELGRQLRVRRLAAGLTQSQLGADIGYSRSAVASAETGYQHVARDFWSRCDARLSTGPALTESYDEIAVLRRAAAEERALAAQARRGSRTATARPVTPAGDPATPVTRPEPSLADAQLRSVQWALRPRHVDEGTVQRSERAALCLVRQLGSIPAPEITRSLDDQLAAVVSWLDRPQPAMFRIRLCAVVARLAGLRARSLADAADPDGAVAWTAVALDAAREAGDGDLEAWLLGTSGPPATEQGEHRPAADPPAADPPVPATTAAASAAPQQPGPPADQGSEAVTQPASDHLRRRVVLGLSMAGAYASARQFDAAAAVTIHTLRLCGRQPVGRIWQRGLQEHARPARSGGDRRGVEALDEQLASVAPALGPVR